MNLEKEVVKIIPDFFEYYLSDYMLEYDNIDDFIISNLEHEIDLYKDWKAEGFECQEDVSYIKKTNIKKVERLLKKYYTYYNSNGGVYNNKEKR